MHERIHSEPHPTSQCTFYGDAARPSEGRTRALPPTPATCPQQRSGDLLPSSDFLTTPGTTVTETGISIPPRQTHDYCGTKHFPLETALENTAGRSEQLNRERPFQSYRGGPGGSCAVKSRSAERLGTSAARLPTQGIQTMTATRGPAYIKSEFSL